MSTTERRAGGHGHEPIGQSAEELARSVAVGHEVSDARTGPLVIGGVGLIILIVVSFGAMGLLLVLAGAGLIDDSNTLGDQQVLELQLPPEPRLEQNPQLNGDEILHQAEVQLESYGWVNKRAGTAHIPIERAMELLLERGVGPAGASPSP